ncbi:MAG: Gfo/Idh/MocA family oxidoreductase [Candidatus Korobacteraceae bacterium]
MAAHHVNNSKLRLAVVGFGDIAKKHLAAFRALGVNVVAAANRSAEGRRKAEQEGGIERTYSDAAIMVERERPDGVLVAASVLSQFDVVRNLIPYEVPLLVEKPPAVSFHDWNLLRAQIEARRLPVMVALNRRYYSVYQRALQRMGGVEAVTAVSVEWSEDAEKMLGLGHPPEMIPLLSFSTSIHGLDLLVFFAGIPINPGLWGRNLDASGDSFRWQMGLCGQTERGAYARFESSWDVPGRWRVVVDAPNIRMVSAPLETAVLYARGQSPETIEASAEDQQFKPGFYGQAAAFLELVRDHNYCARPMASLREISADMELADRLTRACQSSSPADATLLL